MIYFERGEGIGRYIANADVRLRHDNYNCKNRRYKHINIMLYVLYLLKCKFNRFILGKELLRYVENILFINTISLVTHALLE